MTSGLADYRLSHGSLYHLRFTI